jgi:outer membrane PBP1 activator LpoA protein
MEKYTKAELQSSLALAKDTLEDYKNSLDEIANTQSQYTQFLEEILRKIELAEGKGETLELVRLRQETLEEEKDLALVRDKILCEIAYLETRVKDLERALSEETEDGMHIFRSQRDMN